MKKIQAVFCNREQTVPGNKYWPRGGGAFSGDFTINLSPQCSAFSWAVKTEALKVPLFPGPVGTGTTNDWCIIDMFKTNSEYHRIYSCAGLTGSYEPQRQKTYLQTCVPSNDSDRPAHSCNLIRIFTGRNLDSQGCKNSICGQERLVRLPGCACWFESSFCAHVGSLRFLTLWLILIYSEPSLERQYLFPKMLSSKLQNAVKNP